MAWLKHSAVDFSWYFEYAGEWLTPKLNTGQETISQFL